MAVDRTDKESNFEVQKPEVLVAVGKGLGIYLAAAMVAEGPLAETGSGSHTS